MPQGDEGLIRGIRHFCPPIYPMNYPQTKGEIVSYYRQEYGRGWKQKLVHDIAPFTTGKSGQPMKTKNLERRFDPSRLSNVPRTAKEKGQYADLGRTLKPTPDTSKPPTYKYPPQGLKIAFYGQIQISRKWKNASFAIMADENGLGFDEFKSGSDHAKQFLANPSGWDVMWAYFLGEQSIEDYAGNFTVTLG